MSPDRTTTTTAPTTRFRPGQGQARCRDTDQAEWARNASGEGFVRLEQSCDIGFIFTEFA